MKAAFAAGAGMCKLAKNCDVFSKCRHLPRPVCTKA
jgi:hypothetical protein